MQAMNDFVLIEPRNQNDVASEEIKKRSGLLVERKQQGQPDRGHVRIISKEIKDPEYKVGDLVLFNEPHPEGFKQGGISYLPIKHERIIGIIHES